MTGRDDIQQALHALQSCNTCIRFARIDAQTATKHLDGARAKRAAELTEKLADALAFIGRLAFVVEADLRYIDHQAKEENQ